MSSWEKVAFLKDLAFLRCALSYSTVKLKREEEEEEWVGEEESWPVPLASELL